MVYIIVELSWRPEIDPMSFHPAVGYVVPERVAVAVNRVVDTIHSERGVNFRIRPVDFVSTLLGCTNLEASRILGDLEGFSDGVDDGSLSHVSASYESVSSPSVSSPSLPIPEPLSPSICYGDSRVASEEEDDDRSSNYLSPVPNDRKRSRVWSNTTLSDSEDEPSEAIVLSEGVLLASTSSTAGKGCAGRGVVDSPVPGKGCAGRGVVDSEEEEEDSDDAPAPAPVPVPPVLDGRRYELAPLSTLGARMGELTHTQFEIVFRDSMEYIRTEIDKHPDQPMQWNYMAAIYCMLGDRVHPLPATEAVSKQPCGTIRVQLKVKGLGATSLSGVMYANECENYFFVDEFIPWVTKGGLKQPASIQLAVMSLRDRFRSLVFDDLRVHVCARGRPRVSNLVANANTLRLIAIVLGDHVDYSLIGDISDALRADYVITNRRGGRGKFNFHGIGDYMPNEREAVVLFDTVDCAKSSGVLALDNLAAKRLAYEMAELEYDACVRECNPLIRTSIDGLGSMPDDVYSQMASKRRRTHKSSTEDRNRYYYRVELGLGPLP